MSTNLTNRRAGSNPLPKPASAGFQGQIAGASLSDLVQMECLAGSRGAVRVASGDHVGHLFFRGGNVVYALTGSLTGEEAALEMLKWHEGTFQSVEREWPVRDSISCSWQALVIRAAHARDEVAAGLHESKPVQTIVTVRADTVPRALPSPDALDSLDFDSTPIEVAGHTLRGEDFAWVLRLSSTGTLILSQGATQDFADVAAYACRLSELVGMLLGVERFLAMECTFRRGRCFVVLEEDGQVVALGPRPSIDPGPIRELLGT
jgi:hypothetical protein